MYQDLNNLNNLLDTIEQQISGLKENTAIIETLMAIKTEIIIQADNCKQTQGNEKQLAGIVADRTQALLEQEKVFQTMAMTASEGVFIINEEGIIQLVNASVENIFGYLQNELIGQNISLLMPSPHSFNHDNYLKKYIKTGVAHIIGKGRQVTALHKNGTRIPVYLSIGDVQIGDTHLFTGMIIDLSEQINLQNEILKISDQEKIRIGGELHDGIGQQITGLGLLAKSLSNKVENENKALSDQLVIGLQDALQELRLLSRGLVPVSIDVKGLNIALIELCNRMSQLSHIKIIIKADKNVHVSNNVTATHVYRIAQESINNAVKHANASEIQIFLQQPQPERGVLIVKDDGNGFDDKAENYAGSGLRIIKHRCGLFDGEVTYKQSEQGGTEVHCDFPTDKNF